MEIHCEALAEECLRIPLGKSTKTIFLEVLWQIERETCLHGIALGTYRFVNEILLIFPRKCFHYLCGAGDEEENKHHALQVYLKRSFHQQNTCVIIQIRLFKLRTRIMISYKNVVFNDNN